MIKNYFKSAIRKLNRQRGYSMMNIAGLTLGITCSLIIFMIVRFELSFEDFHTKKDRLFKIITHESHSGETSVNQGSPGPLAAAIRGTFPQIERATLVQYQTEGLFTVQQGDRLTKFKEKTGVAYVEPEFFEMFDAPFIAGDERSLSRPDALVLSRNMAAKLFPDGNAMGEKVKFYNSTDFVVTGIVEDFPKNTDFQLTAMLSVENLKSSEKWVFDWRNLSSNVQTYVLLKDGARAGELEKQLIGFADPFRPDSHYKHAYTLQPIGEIHFAVDAGNNLGRAVSRDTLFALGLIGVFLIITAAINFINMATAQAMNRSKEIGVRKVLGAVRGQLVSGFLGETFVLVVTAALLSIGIVEVAGPTIIRALDIQSNLTILNADVLPFLAGLIIVVGLLAGLYPALVLSGFRPAQALRGKIGSGRILMRRGLVVVQFAISQMLIIGTTVVIMQMDFVQNQDMGFVKNGVAMLPLPVNEKDKTELLRTKLHAIPGVEHVSFSYASAISENRWDANVTFISNGHEQNIVSDLKFADHEYLNAYGLQLLAGRNYHDRDTIGEYIVNEAFIHKMGIQNPSDAIGMLIRLGSRRPYMPIVGVVKDFNTTSMHEAIRSTLMATRSNGYQEASVRMSTAGLAGTMRSVEAEWNEVFPEYVFESEFLDQRIESMYRQEQRITFLFQVFAGIAIVIGCIGLLGLVSFMASQKTKEIGVRKVMGARVVDILSIFFKEFVALIGIAFVLAAPVATLVMQGWLENFAYRVSVSVGVFIIAACASIAIAGVTVGYRAFRAATANPIESLRYE